jgi:hypothetical protein
LFSTVTRKNSNTFKFDFSRTSLSNSGCIDLGAFEGYRDGDSVKLEVIYQIARNRPNTIVENIVTNSFYVSKITNPSNPNLNECQQFINRFNYYGYGALAFLGGSIFNGCEDKFINFTYVYINQPMMLPQEEMFFLMNIAHRIYSMMLLVNLPIGFNYLRSEISLIIGSGKENSSSVSSPIFQ